MKIPEAQSLISKLKKEMEKGIVGQTELIEGLLLGILADGHLLIEGVPGLAKTRAVNVLSKVCKVSFKRIQFTPDLLPADIVGTRIFKQANSSFDTMKGPVFANFVLADEINRAPAKVQSALLETMQERQVTIGNDTFQLPSPFFVFATQNPVEQEGTYPLPEAQVDRFLLKLVVDYPDEKEELQIMKMIMNESKFPELETIMDSEIILDLQKLVRTIFIEEKLLHYIKDIVFSTRQPKKFGLNFENVIEYGASPRASIALAQVARVKALLDGRDSVFPEDIKSIAPNVLRHRITPTYYALAENINSAKIIGEILGKIKVP